MKFTKNKKYNALVTAITMSLVMGICGSAMAANLYGAKSGRVDGVTVNNDKGVSTRKADAILTGADFTVNNGEYTVISGGYSNDDSKTNTVTNNKVAICEGTTVTNIAYAGTTNSGSANNNILEVSGGNFTVGQSGDNRVAIIVGRSQNNGTAENNKLIISGDETKIQGSVYAGRANGKNASDANKNIVEISDGEVTGNVYGGCSANNNAAKNVVTISGGTITGDVYCGKADAGTAKDNTVNLIGSGGELTVITSYGSNPELIKNNQEIKINNTVYGGYGKTTENNTLNVAGININVGNIANFNTINFNVTKNMIGKSMLIVKDANNKDTDLPTADGINILAAKDVTLKDGDKITLINKQDSGKLSFGGKVIDEESKEDDAVLDTKVIKSAVDGNAAVIRVGGDGNDLILTIGEAKNLANDEEFANNAKNLVETRVAGLAVVNENVDFMVEHGMANAKFAVKEANAAGDKGLVPFVAVGGGKMRYSTGSHIDSKSWHGAVGVAKEVGNTTIGFAVDHGKSNFDSYNDGGVKGSGDSKATGASVMAEVKKNSGVHYDGSVRVGRVRNDYSSVLSGVSTSYDQSSTYYGLSLGVGKELTVSDKNVIDVYGRYFWTHTNGAVVTDNCGTKLDFDAINSHRVRVGGRFAHNVNDISKLYAGLAWQHEFEGGARATVNGADAPSPSLKGNTGILELGWKIATSKNLDLDLNATGYTGKQKGASLNLAVNFKF